MIPPERYSIPYMHAPEWTLPTDYVAMSQDMANYLTLKASLSGKVCYTMTWMYPNRDGSTAHGVYAEARFTLAALLLDIPRIRRHVGGSQFRLYAAGVLLQEVL